MIDQELVRRRAFERFTQRGYVHGHALEDWLAAERDLAGEGGRPRCDSAAPAAGTGHAPEEVSRAAAAAVEVRPDAPAASPVAPRAGATEPRRRTAAPSRSHRGV